MQAGSWVAGRLWQEVRMEWHQCGEEGDDDLVGESVREDLRQGRGRGRQPRPTGPCPVHTSQLGLFTV